MSSQWGQPWGAPARGLAGTARRRRGKTLRRTRSQEADSASQRDFLLHDCMWPPVARAEGSRRSRGSRVSRWSWALPSSSAPSLHRWED